MKDFCFTRPQNNSTFRAKLFENLLFFPFSSLGTVNVAATDLVRIKMKSDYNDFSWDFASKHMDFIATCTALASKTNAINQYVKVIN